MNAMRLLVAGVVLSSASLAPGDTTYYLDSAGGSDGHDGRSEAMAWKTLEKANSVRLTPGDRLLIKAGTEYHGQLWPKGSGAEGRPVVVDRYGEGEKPAIHADGKHPEAVRIHNSEHIEVRNLEITNKGPERKPRLSGVSVTLEDFGTARGVVVGDLYVHDVYGSNVKKDGGGTGIVWSVGGKKTKSRFDGLVIERNRLVRTDRNGIVGGSDYCGRDNWYPSLNVAIRHNVLEDIGGDGIVPIGTDGCVVEHNRIVGGRTRAEDWAAGIWPWSADNTVIQFNEVSGYKGTRDGQGFDSDWNCRGTVIQYNYSHDNEGGFILICCDGTSSPVWSAGNTGTIVRYNVSRNDGMAAPGSRTIHVSGPVDDVQFYNNTIYLDRRFRQPMLLVGNWGGWPKTLRFTNNIFLVEGEANWDFSGQGRGMTFLNNVYWGRQTNRPADERALAVDPRLRDLGSLDGMSPGLGSPCIDAADQIRDNGGRDYAGKKLGPKPDVGAFEAD